MKESVRKTLMFLMAVGFLTGFALLLYPMFSNMWNEYNSKLKFEEYQHENAEKAEDTSLEEEWEKAAAYNERLQPIVIPDSFIQAEQEEVTQQDSEYMSCLNQNGDGMMGYLSIPKIGELYLYIILPEKRYYKKEQDISRVHRCPSVERQHMHL